MTLMFEVSSSLCERHNFLSPTCAGDKENWPFEIVDSEGLPHIKVTSSGEEKVFSSVPNETNLMFLWKVLAPEEVSSMVLVKMKETAEAFLGKTVK